MSERRSQHGQRIALVEQRSLVTGSHPCASWREVAARRLLSTAVVDEPAIFTFDGFPTDLEPLAQKIEAAMRRDPNYAELVVRWLADSGIAASHDAAEDARVFAILMSRQPESDPEKVMTAMGELVGVIALTGIGVVGIFDPSPVVDGAGTVVALGMMRYSGWYFVDAALSGVSMVPYLGDAVGKPALLARMAKRINDITRLLNRFSTGMGAHVKTAIEAIKRGHDIPRLPRGAVAVLSKAVTTGSKNLDDVLEALRRVPDVPYARMDQLKAYMKRRGVSVWDGKVGADALDKMGDVNAAGCFIVMRGKDGKEITGFIFRGTPNRSVVHHELWHRNDFVRRHGGKLDRWAGESTSIDKERYVHQRMTGTGGDGAARGQARWGEYPVKEQVNQAAYISKLEQEQRLRDVIETLGTMGIKLE